MERAAPDDEGRSGPDPRVRRRRLWIVCSVLALSALGAAVGVVALGVLAVGLAYGPSMPEVNALSPAGWSALLADARALTARPEARGSYAAAGAIHPQHGTPVSASRPTSALPASLASLGALEVSVGEHGVSLLFRGGMGYGYTLRICADEREATPASEPFFLYRQLRPGVYVVVPHH